MGPVSQFLIPAILRFAEIETGVLNHRGKFIPERIRDNHPGPVQARVKDNGPSFAGDRLASEILFLCRSAGGLFRSPGGRNGFGAFIGGRGGVGFIGSRGGGFRPGFNVYRKKKPRLP